MAADPFALVFAGAARFDAARAEEAAALAAALGRGAAAALADFFDADRVLAAEPAVRPPDFDLACDTAAVKDARADRVADACFRADTLPAVDVRPLFAPEVFAPEVFATGFLAADDLGDEVLDDKALDEEFFDLGDAEALDADGLGAAALAATRARPLVRAGA